jgi:hypothetical protein
MTKCEVCGSEKETRLWETEGGEFWVEEFCHVCFAKAHPDEPRGLRYSICEGVLMSRLKTSIMSDIRKEAKNLRRAKNRRDSGSEKMIKYHIAQLQEELAGATE